MLNTEFSPEVDAPLGSVRSYVFLLKTQVANNPTGVLGFNVCFKDRISS